MRPIKMHIWLFALFLSCINMEDCHVTNQDNIFSYILELYQHGRLPWDQSRCILDSILELYQHGRPPWDQSRSIYGVYRTPKHERYTSDERKSKDSHSLTLPCVLTDGWMKQPVPCSNSRTSSGRPAAAKHSTRMVAWMSSSWRQRRGQRAAGGGSGETSGRLVRRGLLAMRAKLLGWERIWTG